MQPTPTAVLENPTGLIIEPQDTLFFRDGRPFGPTDFGRSQLPLPQIVAGMLRTHMMKAFTLHPSQIHGLREKTDNVDVYQRALAFIACRGPWLIELEKGNIKDFFVPAPANLCRLDKDKNKLALLKPLKEGLPGWNSPARQENLKPLIYGGSAEKTEPETRWLNKNAIHDVLKGQTPEDKDLREPNDLFLWEERTGVSISPDSGTGEDSRLYSSRQLRLKKNIAFYAEVGWETVDQNQRQTLEEIKESFEKWSGWNKLFPDEGQLLAFGGEGRRALVKIAKEPLKWPETKIAANNGVFTWIISPVVFYQHVRTNGQRAPWEPPMLGNLIGAACPAPLAVSGWDMAGNKQNNWTNRPRPTRYAVPSGAVYFWERGKNADPEKPWLPGPLVQLAENAKDRANGWGIALKGKW